jgi:hypothetical protein
MTGSTEEIETVVIGGGHAGLSTVASGDCNRNVEVNGRCGLSSEMMGGRN